MQDALTKLSQRTGMRILGPNCIGIVSDGGRLRMTFAVPPDVQPKPLAIGVASQSGGLGVALAQGVAHGYAFAHILTAGNSCDVDIADQIAFLAESPRCKVIACQFEGMADPQRLLEAARRAARAGKPVIVQKIATGEQGTLAAMSHTGSLAGPAAVSPHGAAGRLSRRRRVGHGDAAVPRRRQHQQRTGRDDLARHLRAAAGLRCRRHAAHRRSRARAAHPCRAHHGDAHARPSGPAAPRSLQPRHHHERRLAGAGGDDRTRARRDGLPHLHHPRPDRGQRRGLGHLAPRHPRTPDQHHRPARAARRGAHRRPGHGRGVAPGRAGRDPGAGLPGDARLLQPARGRGRRGGCGGLAAHRRHRHHGCRGRDAHHRPAQGLHHPRRRKHLPAGNRGRAGAASGGARGAGDGRARRAVGRGGGGGAAPAAGGADGPRTLPVVPRAAGRVQVPGALVCGRCLSGHHLGKNPEVRAARTDRHRIAAAGALRQAAARPRGKPVHPGRRLGPGPTRADRPRTRPRAGPGAGFTGRNSDWPAAPHPADRDNRHAWRAR